MTEIISPQLAYYYKNKEKVLKKLSAWYVKNREKITVRKKEYYQKNKKFINEKKKIYNKIRWQKDPEYRNYHKIKEFEWRKNNKKKCLEYSRKAYYRNRKLLKGENGQAIHLPSKDKVYFGGKKIIVLERDNLTCQKCFGSSGDKKLTIHHKDHNGSNVSKENKNNSLENLVTLCNTCHLGLHKRN